MPKSGQVWDRNFLQNEPLFRPFEPIASRFRSEQWPTLAQYSEVGEERRQALCPNLSPLVFTPTPKKPRRFRRERVVLGELYDARIAARGEVPCLMHSYHDLLNAIAFAAFPEAKRRLHQRQYEAVTRWIPPEAERLPGRRTREQDALTIFDEGGVVLLMTHAFYDKWLRKVEPQPIEAANGESGVQPVLFGHALLEHLHDGHQALRASAVVVLVNKVQPGDALLAQADAGLSQRLADPAHFQRPDADSIFERGPGGVLWIRAIKGSV